MPHIIGANPTGPAGSLTDGKSFGLGDRVTDHNGNEWIYVQAGAGGVTGVGYVVSISPLFVADMLSTANDARGNRIGVAAAAFGANEYGWVQIFGPCLLRGAANAAANARLNSTATAGQIDDDGTAGAFEISGMAFTTVMGGAPGNAAALLNYPIVGPVI